MHDNPEYQPKTAEQAMARLVEECGELIAAYGKLQRFGPQSVNPELPPEEQETNIDWFDREMGDVFHAIAEYRNLRFNEAAAAMKEKGR